MLGYVTKDENQSHFRLLSKNVSEDEFKVLMDFIYSIKSDDMLQKILDIEKGMFRVRFFGKIVRD